MPTSTIHTPFPKLMVRLLAPCTCLILFFATMTRARSAMNTMVDTIAVATDKTREMTQVARWKTQHEAMTGRAVRNARTAAMGCRMSKRVRALRMRFARSGWFVTAARIVGSIVYPSCGPIHSPLLVNAVGLFNALVMQKPHTPTRISVPMLVAGNDEAGCPSIRSR